ncbi:MAG: hypothetical protein U0894_08770 [Pirellulales bacterium]
MLASFAIMGGVGLVWTVLRLGISAERRSALTREASSMDLFHAVVPLAEKFPTLPPHDGLTNSPGIELAYRLPPAESPMATFGQDGFLTRLEYAWHCADRTRHSRAPRGQYAVAA